ncbi:hypothetical protein T440DRAFT_318060 [Plenodomus tracheiphilus IPT5]|uniref:Uncharacterized protein n=1 Tax=Plenodomus tracheiphilus IPT5 TaxID=1408161 RepID=A0A6A7BC04_9PLEO|nr:hypothetical protein T440DRAFT_318060 [Plenodomus tracheiphilus IPT5]
MLNGNHSNYTSACCCPGILLLLLLHHHHLCLHDSHLYRLPDHLYHHAAGDHCTRCRLHPGVHHGCPRRSYPESHLQVGKIFRPLANYCPVVLGAVVLHAVADSNYPSRQVAAQQVEEARHSHPEGRLAIRQQHWAEEPSQVGEEAGSFVRRLVGAMRGKEGEGSSVVDLRSHRRC